MLFPEPVAMSTKASLPAMAASITCVCMASKKMLHSDTCLTQQYMPYTRALKTRSAHGVPLKQERINEPELDAHHVHRIMLPEGLSSFSLSLLRKPAATKSALRCTGTAVGCRIPYQYVIGQIPPVLNDQLLGELVHSLQDPRHSNM